MKIRQAKKIMKARLLIKKEQSLVSCNKSSLLEDETQFDAYT